MGRLRKGRKVIELFPRDEQEFHQFLDMLRDTYDENRLKNFICIYDYEFKEDDERVESYASGIDTHWFGDKSTIYILGLIEMIKQEVMDWLDNNN